MLLSNTRNTWILLYLFCDRDASMFQKERKQKIILLKVPEFVKKNTFRVTIEISSKSFNWTILNLWKTLE